MSSPPLLETCAAEIGRIIESSGASLNEEQFNDLACTLFQAQYAHNPAFAALCRARGMSPGSIRSWDRIPAVPAAAFKELDLSCLPVAERTSVFYSSGTTGQRPSRHYHSTASLKLYETSLTSGFTRRFGPDWRELRLLFLTPPVSEAPHSSLVHMFATLSRISKREALFAAHADSSGAWVLDCEGIVRCLSSRCPVFLLGTAFSFVHLLDFLQTVKLEVLLPEGSLVMETGGYKGRSRAIPKKELHRLIGNRLGVAPKQIAVEYGMSELSSQAYDSLGPAGERHLKFPPWARARIVSPETGEEIYGTRAGLIQVFDLANVYSLMAVQTEDLGVRKGGGFELLGRAETAEPRGCSLMPVSGGLGPIG